VLIRVENPHSSRDNGHAIVHVLDDLDHCIYARGFSDGLHDGIVSLKIRTENP
jgi:hypothetical protein